MGCWKNSKDAYGVEKERIHRSFGGAVCVKSLNTELVICRTRKDELMVKLDEFRLQG